MIAVINYGMGNPGSIINMLKKIGFKAIYTRNPQEIILAEKLIFPGVGAFDTGMSTLHDSGLIPILEEAVFTQKKPLLGICLGMQLLGQSSEEGILPGLGWVAFHNERFKFPVESPLKIPHMGWNTIKYDRESPLLTNLPILSRFILFTLITPYARAKRRRWPERPMATILPPLFVTPTYTESNSILKKVIASVCSY
jgi:glutamine amidotransferase